MVQERLDQMIRERFVESRNEGRRRESRGYGDGKSGGTKCIVMVAMDKCSFDPRKDFRDSMVEMITANQIEDPKDLRCLLNCYVSMNSSEYKPLILLVFHEVCCDLFLRCKYHY
ncbi:hypothetical protein Scep_012740 [Stephania cephalantha]|uniref:Transcription repressor n=1 Tax=Stephania cephalantha TaxID=152367 RepID=A0AAP0JG38_9MAGN